MKTALLPALFVTLLAISPAALAEDYKPDDTVTFDLVAEDWVTTQTARVSVTVDAAVSGEAAGTMRDAMVKAVSGLAKGEWKLTGFSRGQDSTGLERWNATYEARLPEAALGGLHDIAKKQSKAGMQIKVMDIDFSPTLAEMEAARAGLRAQLVKQAGEQLATINATLPGRNYRIGEIGFGGASPPMRPMMMKTMRAEMATFAADTGGAEPMERAQKVTMSARVVYAALAPAAK
ncbi:MAG: hypothetical protein GC131_08780 [Alphaproteobacteria bacterium]|nr:hypothetical protein [Alphaproteobacteria bacterium]